MAQKLKIIPLGGLDEIGKNMTVYEYGGDIFVVDAGVAFPDVDMLGVDLVIPDITYLVKNKDKIRGIVLTHGHEDHIGALPYVLKEVNVPVYCTALTAGIIEIRLSEHHMLDRVKINRVKAGQNIKLGCFTIEFINVNHSIMDAVALAITTPVGIVVQTGDFKIDPTPIMGEMTDLTRFGELGRNGVALLLSDSTNVERPGYTMSERTVGESFDTLFKNSDQRILVATFASNVQRIQQVVNTAVNHGRKVAVSGRSLDNIIAVATQLGYIDIPKDVLIDISAINKYPKEKICIITTGSQGESMSALYRMAFANHRQVEIGPGDKVIISASSIPGNEKTVYRVINELFKKGADVVYERLAEVHVSGHACQEELKMMLALVKPKYFMPVHGEHRHLKTHAQIASIVGVNPDNIIIASIGNTIELSKTDCKMGNNVPAGRVFVDGLGVGDVGTVVLRDRKHLSQDGMIVIVVTLSTQDGSITAGPDIVSRGFIYVRENEELMEQLRKVALDTLENCHAQKITDWTTIKATLKESVSEMLYKTTKRSPMILPIIMEV